MGGNKIIFGFTGLIASGKGYAAEYLHTRYNASTYRFSTMLRDALDRFYIPQTRDNIIKISEIMRGTFGEDIMAKTMAQDVASNASSLIVVEGIRRPADIEYLARMPNFVLVEVFADSKIRYERVVQRAENIGDSAKTYEEFMADHKRSTELSILEVIKSATEKIDNNGDVELYHKQLDALVAKYT